MSHSQTTHDIQAHEKLQDCIDACSECHETCLHMAMTHCLDEGGKKLEAGHFRLMINCAEICQTTSNFLLSGSAFHKDIAAVCAKICEACAESCADIEGMEDCAITCRDCAESCRQMSDATQ